MEVVEIRTDRRQGQGNWGPKNALDLKDRRRQQKPTETNSGNIGIHSGSGLQIKCSGSCAGELKYGVLSSISFRVEEQ